MKKILITGAAIDQAAAIGKVLQEMNINADIEIEATSGAGESSDADMSALNELAHKLNVANEALSKQSAVNIGLRSQVSKLLEDRDLLRGQVVDFMSSVNHAKEGFNIIKLDTKEPGIAASATESHNLVTEAVEKWKLKPGDAYEEVTVTTAAA